MPARGQCGFGGGGGLPTSGGTITVQFSFKEWAGAVPPTFNGQSHAMGSGLVSSIMTAWMINNESSIYVATAGTITDGAATTWNIDLVDGDTGLSPANIYVPNWSPIRATLSGAATEGSFDGSSGDTALTITPDNGYESGVLAIMLNSEDNS